LSSAVGSSDGSRHPRALHPFPTRRSSDLLGITVTDDPLAAFAKADGVLDFTAPAASIEFAGYAAQARIVHVIGTTGFSEEDEARSEEHTSELQSRENLVCRLLLEKKKRSH